ncbi:hypothetical protein [Hydrogenispora ethanolica]|uniref:hypothetical protein n=1 Tax=Hydrogenispora ethanolica TaxID=1082276 RepID=UPI001050D4B7|nr:hypothetical protein [Hydrogenispora ethanolica]
MANSKRLRQAFRNPCDFCGRICPVGEDREFFQSTNPRKYLDEREILAKNPHKEEYRDWLHIRKYGGYPLAEEQGEE